MNKKKWAEKEVQIACKRENSDRKDGEWDYRCACYKSALKAFNSLLEDEHSGFSIAVTKYILNRLIEGKPLTPIEDTEDVWNNISDISGLRGEKVNYQCGRMSSLLKYVYEDGKIIYRDVDRVICFNVNNPDIPYSNGTISKVIDEMFPITMPYYPIGHIKVYCEEFLTDERNGDFDTIGILYGIKPTGERLEINRYFKEEKDGFVEIDRQEYLTRMEMSKEEREKNG